MAAILVGGGGGLSDTILKGDHPRTIPPKFGSNWFSGFIEELIKMQKADDGCPVVAIAHLTLWVR